MGIAGAVRADVVNFGRAHAGIIHRALDGRRHTFQRAGAVVIAHRAMTEDFGQRCCPARQRMLQPLKDEHGGPLGKQSAFAVFIERTVEHTCQRGLWKHTRGRERGHGERVDRRIGAACDHDVRFPFAN